MEACDASRNRRSARASVPGQPGVGEQAGNLAGIRPENRRIRGLTALKSDFALQDHEEPVRRIAQMHQNISRLETNRFKILRQPGEVLLRQVREDLKLAQIADQGVA